MSMRALVAPWRVAGTDGQAGNKSILFTAAAQAPCNACCFKFCLHKSSRFCLIGVNPPTDFMRQVVNVHSLHDMPETMSIDTSHSGSCIPFLSNAAHMVDFNSVSQASLGFCHNLEQHGD